MSISLAPPAIALIGEVVVTRQEQLGHWSAQQLTSPQVGSKNAFVSGCREQSVQSVSKYRLEHPDGFFTLGTRPTSFGPC